MAATYLDISAVGIEFDTNGEKFRALRDVNLKLDKGEFVEKDRLALRISVTSTVQRANTVSQPNSAGSGTEAQCLPTMDGLKRCPQR